MFEMYPGALEMEMQRRREVLAGTMRAALGIKRVNSRVPGTVRFRHALAAIATSAIALL
jgi:hypothetical protein